MSVDLNRLTAHLAPQQQADIAKAYHRDADHSTTAFLYCFFLGTLGAHRFYLRQWRKGFAHLLLTVLIVAVLVAGIALNWSPLLLVALVIPLAVIALIWEIIDLFTIDHEVYTRNLKLAEQLIAGSLLADRAVERAADSKMESMLRATETQATTATTRDQTAADIASAAVVTQEAQAVAAPALMPGDGAAETVSAESRHDASAAIASGEYIATTTTQISENPEGARQPETSRQAEPSSWSETESYHAGALEATGDAASVEDIVSQGGDIVGENADEAEATAGDYSYDQSLTRSHEASAYSVTDSAELMTTVAAADSTQVDEQATAEEETPLSPQEAEAATWPDHAPVSFDEPEPAVQRDEPTWGAMEVAAGAVAVVAGGESLAGIGAYAAGPDATDMSQYPGAVETIADIEGSNAAPLYISLPDEPLPGAPAAEPSYFDATDSALPPDDLGAMGGAGDLGDGLVVFIPDQIGAGVVASEYSAPVEPLAPSHAPPAAAYVPPTVPVITTLGASALQAGAEPTPESLAAMPAPEPPAWQDTPSYGEPVHAESHTGAGETLAEVAGAAAFGVGAGALVDRFAHRDDQPAEESSASVEATPPAGAPLAAQSVSPVAEPAPVLPDATAESGATEEQAALAEAPHHRKRHIRVVRQVKVGGEVVEEMAAEEYIDEDADPEPVRQRLEAMLRQRASGAIPTSDLPDASQANAE